MTQSNNPESLNAFLLQAQLKEELDNYEKEKEKGKQQIGGREIPDEKPLSEVRAYLDAGSQMLLHGSENREAEATLLFWKGRAMLENWRIDYQRKFDKLKSEQMRRNEWKGGCFSICFYSAGPACILIGFLMEFGLLIGIGIVISVAAFVFPSIFVLFERVVEKFQK